MRVTSVNVGRVQRVMVKGRTLLTAMKKSEARGDVSVGVLGLEGDHQADKRIHGGRDKAVYAYGANHFEMWGRAREAAGVSLWGGWVGPGDVGENLTLDNLDEALLWIGDRLVLVGCEFEVSEPRQPCGKFNTTMGFEGAGRLMLEHGCCGAYLRVLKAGVVRADDEVTVIPGPRRVCLLDAFRGRDRSVMARS